MHSALPRRPTSHVAAPAGTHAPPEATEGAEQTVGGDRPAAAAGGTGATAPGAATTGAARHVTVPEPLNQLLRPAQPPDHRRSHGSPDRAGRQTPTPDGQVGTTKPRASAAARGHAAPPPVGPSAHTLSVHRVPPRSHRAPTPTAPTQVGAASAPRVMGSAVTQPVAESKGDDGEKADARGHGLGRGRHRPPGEPAGGRGRYPADGGAGVGRAGGAPVTAGAIRTAAAKTAAAATTTLAMKEWREAQGTSGVAWGGTAMLASGTAGKQRPRGTRGVAPLAAAPGVADRGGGGSALATRVARTWGGGPRPTATERPATGGCDGADATDGPRRRAGGGA